LNLPVALTKKKREEGAGAFHSGPWMEGEHRGGKGGMTSG